MPDPLELLNAAHLLASTQAGQAPKDAMLRRAPSSAYHAMFHQVARGALERFVGAGRPEVALLIESAASAPTAFDNVPDGERNDVPMLLNVGSGS